MRNQKKIDSLSLEQKTYKAACEALTIKEKAKYFDWLVEQNGNISIDVVAPLSKSPEWFITKYGDEEDRNTDTDSWEDISLRAVFEKAINET
jgi:hypothetical protein